MSKLQKVWGREEGLGRSAPTQNPSHQFQALHTHLRSSIPILDPLTFPWRFTNTLDPPHQSQALLIYLIPYIPIPDVPYQALHTHVNPYPHIRFPPYTPKPSILIPGPPHTFKDHYTHLRHSIPNQSPSH